MKKKWWIIGIATLAIAGGIAVVIPMLRPPRPGVTKANFDRIKKGMTEADAEAILGSPSQREIIIARGKAPGGEPMVQFIQLDEGKGCAWSGTDGDVIVHFDSDGAIASMIWRDHERMFFERIRDWIGLPK
jgi:hypothetical protein